MNRLKDAIRRFFRLYWKPLVGLLLVVLVVSLSLGGLFAYRYFTGPERAFKDLRAALNGDDRAGLAHMVDFNALAEELVAAVFAAYPQEADAMRQAEMRDEVQRLILKALAAEKAAKPESSPPRKLFEAIPPVPEDVIIQFTQEMRLEKTPASVQIASRFTHNGLQADMPLRLLMERRQGVWMVTRLLNARELVGLYKSATDAVQADDEARLAEKNEKIMARMRAHFHAPSCLASVHRRGGEAEAMLVVKVTANNTESTTLHNVNILCDVRAGNGTPLYARQLGVVQRVYAGASFANTWTVILEGEDAARLLQAGPLSCSVEPKVMSVGLGDMLYLRKD